jgi:hypothetical protein
MKGALEAAPADSAAPLYAYVASDLTEDVPGQISIAAGGFIGQFGRSTPAIIGFGNHHDTPPSSAAELRGLAGDKSKTSHDYADSRLGFLSASVSGSGRAKTCAGVGRWILTLLSPSTASSRVCRSWPCSVLSQKWRILGFASS